jgi:2-polyprenyl-3-methyl-5-hydroxy-6-metoxy-1,4-benzoquinol methylase
LRTVSQPLAGGERGMRPEKVDAALVCPLCMGRVRGSELRCLECGRGYNVGDRGDFRLAQGETIARRSTYRRPECDEKKIPLRLEAAARRPRNSYSGPIPVHLTRSQLSYLPSGRSGDVVLDLGCGHGIHRRVLEALGYTYYGVDYEGEAAMDLVDAHALPYADDTFDLVIAIAVLEHLAMPLQAVREVFRVLRPGAYFVGTAAFLEPYHDLSYFHMSHLGVWFLLMSGGFEVEVISPIAKWDVMRAQVAMEMPASVLQPAAWAGSMMFRAWLELYGWLGRRIARRRERYAREALLARHAGAFFFVSKKSHAGAAR